MSEPGLVVVIHARHYARAPGESYTAAVSLILRIGDGWDRLVVGPGSEAVRERVSAAPVVTDHGAGLVESTP